MVKSIGTLKRIEPPQSEMKNALRIITDGIEIVGSVRTIERGEDRLQAVVMFLADGIKLVIVTLRALDRPS